MLNLRQARWAQTLATSKFRITNRPRPSNGKPDSQTRRSPDLPGKGDERLTQQRQLVFPSCVLNRSVLYSAPKFNHKYLLNFQRKTLLPPRISLAAITLTYNPGAINDFRFLQIVECKVRPASYGTGLLYIPNNQELKHAVLHSCHNASSAGHPGRALKQELMTTNYYWPQTRKYTARYVDHYDTSARTKPVCHALYGLLQSITAPGHPRSSISMDIASGLPNLTASTPSS